MTEFTTREVGEAWLVYILSELFEQWPRKIDISAEMVREATGQDVDDEDEFFDHLIEWLEKEGYIRVSQDAPEGMALGVSLTGKGNALLLEKETSEKSLGQRMKEEVASWGKEGLTAARKETIAQLIRTGVGAAARYIAGI